jgi:hypothetical protein
VIAPPTHYSADELTALLGLYDLELFDLVDAGVLQLEADGFTRASVERLMASGRG